MKNKNITTKKDIERIKDRQQKVFKMLIQGVRVVTMAEYFKVSERTILRDLKEFREARSEWFEEQRKNFDIVGYWSERLQAVDLLIETAWSYSSESDVRDRVRVLDQLMTLYNQKESILRSAGVLKSTPENDDSYGVQMVFHCEGPVSPFQRRTEIMLERRNQRLKEEREQQSLRSENEEDTECDDDVTY